MDSMEESGCDDDVIAAANADIQDSEDFEYFYDWLIKQCDEVTRGARSRHLTYFVRYVRV